MPVAIPILYEGADIDLRGGRFQKKIIKIYRNERHLIKQLILRITDFFSHLAFACNRAKNRYGRSVRYRIKATRHRVKNGRTSGRKFHS